MLTLSPRSFRGQAEGASQGRRGGLQENCRRGGNSCPTALLFVILLIPVLPQLESQRRCAEMVECERTDLMEALATRDISIQGLEAEVGWTAGCILQT